MSRLFLFIVCCFCIPEAAFTQTVPVILSERDRARVIDDILEERMEHLLPTLMRREGIDMWVIIAREYNEDPVMKTMLPSTWISARRRTIMVFYDPGEGKSIDRLAIARYDVGSLLKGEWDINADPNQWDALIKLINAKKPKKIGVNTSYNFGLADGIAYTEYSEFLEKLPAEHQSKVISAEKLAIGWLETRTEKEMLLYPVICRITHQLIQEAFSEKIILPGVTTTEDVVWYLRQRCTDLGLATWFHPTVSIQRRDEKEFDHLQAFTKQPGEQVIFPGDLLHVDFGIQYLRLHSDQQQHAYVLRPGETDVPERLKAAFTIGKRLQDILVAQFQTGKTGNEMLSQALALAQQEGIVASIYSHPIGFHGHAAGPAIGMWDNQGFLPGNGEYPLFENTAYSIELNISAHIPEWDKTIRIMLEENGYFDGHNFRYMDGRQESMYTIPRLP